MTKKQLQIVSPYGLINKACKARKCKDNKKSITARHLHSDSCAVLVQWNTPEIDLRQIPCPLNRITTLSYWIATCVFKPASRIQIVFSVTILIKTRSGCRICNLFLQGLNGRNYIIARLNKSHAINIRVEFALLISNPYNLSTYIYFCRADRRE